MSESVKQTQLYESLSALVDNEATELEVHRLLAESEKEAGVRARWYRYQLARAAMKGDVGNAYTSDIADAVRQAVSDIHVDGTDSHEADGVEPATAGQGDRDAEAGDGRSTSAPGGWRAHLGRVAIAAGVAGVVVLGGQQLPGLSGASDAGPAMAETEQAEPANQQLVPASGPAADQTTPLPAVDLRNVSTQLGQTEQRSRLPQQTFLYSPTAQQQPAQQQQQQQQLQDEQVRLYIEQLMAEHAEHAAQNGNAGMLPFARVPADSAEAE